MFGRKARLRIEQLERQLATALGIIAERGHEIDELRQAKARIRQDLTKLQARFPGLSLDARAATEEDDRYALLSSTDHPVRFWICPVEGHTKVEWAGNVAHCMTPGCGRSSLTVPGLSQVERDAYLAAAADNASWVEFDKRAERREDTR